MKEPIGWTFARQRAQSAPAVSPGEQQAEERHPKVARESRRELEAWIAGQPFTDRATMACLMLIDDLDVAEERIIELEELRDSWRRTFEGLQGELHTEYVNRIEAEAQLSKACAFEAEGGDVVWCMQGLSQWRLRDANGYDLIVDQRVFWGSYEEAKAALDAYRAQEGRDG